MHHGGHQGQGHDGGEHFGGAQAVAALSGQTVTPAVHTSLAALTTTNLDANAQYVYKNSC